MNFSLPQEPQDLQARTREFISTHVIPLETEQDPHAHGPSEALRGELVKRARRSGLLTTHASPRFGRMGLSRLAKAVVFEEEAGYSCLGPIALNVHAQGEGNIPPMEEVATSQQQERWLRPQVEGRTPSCFAMTEPDGTGSDPAMLQITGATNAMTPWPPVKHLSIASICRSRRIPGDPIAAPRFWGGRGVTGESVVMRIFTDMLYDGPIEVHRWSMACKVASSHGMAA